MKSGHSSTIPIIAALASVTLLATPSELRAGAIPVPNGSFESQVVAPPFPVNNRIDAWQKSPQPGWFDPSSMGITWDQLSGVFANPPAGQPDHIDNLSGNQAAYLFALPQVALFQDYQSTDWNHPTPQHGFDATFEVGKSYELLVGVIGGGGGMTPGTSLELGLYYLDATNGHVMVASTPITYTTATFPTTTHFLDFQVTVPEVQAGDAWAGRHLGVQLASTFGTGAGYWDVDNLRLTAVPEPGPLAALVAGLGGWLLVLRRHRISPGR